jgi:hypothetical protein
MSRYLSFATLALIVGLPAHARAASKVLQSRPTNGYVVGGTTVEPCQWPTSVSLGGCTATLVHPRLITYAAHCGASWGAATFGERAQGGRSVGIDHCVTNPGFTGDNLGAGYDFAYCVLDEEVTDVPITPIAQGCELEAVKPGAKVWIVGFGATAGQDQGSPGGGTKRQVEVEINRLVDNGEVDVGGGGKGGCHGDSGGPLFLQLPKEIDPLEGWRVIGATSWGDTTCPGVTNYSYLPDKDGVPWIESDSGIDITPCHDALTGEWDPGPDCKEFATDPSEAGRSWSNGCAQEMEINSQCGGALDEEAPVVEITAPEDGDTFDSGEKIKVTANATDNGEVASVELFVDGASHGVDSEAPYEWADLELDDGEHELEAKAIDSAGNEGTSKKVTVSLRGEETDASTDSSDDDDDTPSSDDDDDTPSSDGDDDTASSDDDDDSASGDGSSSDDDDDDDSATNDDSDDDDSDSDDDDGGEDGEKKGCAISDGPTSPIGLSVFFAAVAAAARRRKKGNVAAKFDRRRR